MPPRVLKSGSLRKSTGPFQLFARGSSGGKGANGGAGLLGYEEFLQLPARDQIAYLEKRHRAVTHECDNLVNAAGEEAEQITASARAQMEADRRKAREEGYAAGMEEARSKLRSDYGAQLPALLQRLDQTIGDAATAQQQYLDALAQPLVSLLMEVVRKLYWDSQMDAPRLAEIVSAVSAALRSPDHLAVRVNPRDAEAVECAGFTEALEGAGLSSSRVQLTPDPSLKRGECRIVYGSAEMVLDPDGVFALLQRTLLNAAESAGGGAGDG